MIRLHALVVCFVAASAIPAFAASSTGSTNLAGQTFAINGVACLEVSAWSGGSAVGSVTVLPATGTSAAKKHLSGVRYEPVVVQAVLPLSAALSQCVADLCSSGAGHYNLQLTNLDGSGRVMGTPLVANNAVLVELQMPALDAALSNPVSVTLVFQPENVQAAATASASKASTSSRPTYALTSGFQFQLGGLNGATVGRVEPFTIRRAAAAGTGADEVRSYSTTPARTEFPNLVLTFGGTTPADWAAWHEDFVVNGNCGDTQEKSGVLEFRAPNQKDALFALQLGHVGITGLSLPLDASGRPGRARCELYCESMNLGSGAAKNAVGRSTGASEATSDTAAATTTPGQAPEVAAVTPATPATAAAPVGRPLPTAPVPITARTTPPTITPAPSATASPPLVAPEAVPIAPAPRDAPVRAGTPPTAATAVKSPDDKGSRDPAEFPRPEGSVRTSYTGNRQKGWLQELVGYTAPSNSEEIAAFYEQTLTEAGWEETSRSENDNAVESAHQVLMQWKKGSRTAMITIVDVSPGKVTIMLRIELTS